MKDRIKRIGRWLGYPLLYVGSLAFFFYVTFPMEALRGRILAEFDRQQRQGRARDEAVMTLEIGALEHYWFTGVELKQVRLTVPPRIDAQKGPGSGLSLGSTDGAPPLPSVITIDRCRARVRILPLLLGHVFLDFQVNAFGGSIHGTAPYATPGKVDVELENVHLEQVEPLKAMLQQQPIVGVLHGAITLQPVDGKFAKASGKMDLQLDDVSIFDGKSKLLGLVLPTAQIGRVTLAAKADKGQLTIEELSVQGKDLELSGEGKIRLNESYKRSTADFFLQFKFSDTYRDSDDATRSLLGKAGSKIKPAIEALDPQRTFVRAKTEDDFYRFHLVGRLDKLDIQPAGVGGGPGKTSPGRSPLLSASPGGLRPGRSAATDALEDFTPGSASAGPSNGEPAAARPRPGSPAGLNAGGPRPQPAEVE